MLSSLPYLELVSSIYGIIFIGFGILWFINIPKSLSFFELPYPKIISSKGSAKSSAEVKQLVDVFAVVYGIRDVYMGVSIIIAALFGTRQVLGWIIVAAASVAATDGAACFFIVGKGAGNHWSYAPVMAVLGGVLLGFFDWVPVENLKLFGQDEL